MSAVEINGAFPLRDVGDLFSEKKGDTNEKISLCTTGGRIIHQVAHSSIGTIETVKKVVSGFFTPSSVVYDLINSIVPPLKYFALAGIGLTPLFVYQIGVNIHDCIKGDLDKWECLLDSTRNLSYLTLTIAYFLKDLALMGAIPLQFVSYLTPFDIAGVAVSIAWAISNYRDGKKVAKFSEKLNMLNSTDDIRELIGTTDPKVVENIFNMKTSVLTNKLHGKDINEVLPSLKGRVKQQITHHKLMVISSTVSAVTNSVLLASAPLAAACPPLIPILYVLKTGGTALSLFSIGKSFYQKYQFKKIEWYESTPFMEDLVGKTLQV